MSLVSPLLSCAISPPHDFWPLGCRCSIEIKPATSPHGMRAPTPRASHAELRGLGDGPRLDAPPNRYAQQPQAKQQAGGGLGDGVRVPFDEVGA
jgi:hypothetical protein